MHYDPEREKEQREEEQQTCFSCDKEFSTEDHNDREQGWFCDNCLNHQHKINQRLIE